MAPISQNFFAEGEYTKNTPTTSRISVACNILIFDLIDLIGQFHVSYALIMNLKTNSLRGFLTAMVTSVAHFCRNISPNKKNDYFHI